MWSGVERRRVTLPNSAAGHAVTTPVVVFEGAGFPPVTPKGPNLLKAATACAPTPVGKQAARVARPAGVGVIPPLANGLFTLMISSLKPPDMKTLFLIHGPPSWKPVNSSFRRGG